MDSSPLFETITSDNRVRYLLKSLSDREVAVVVKLNESQVRFNTTFVDLIDNSYVVLSKTNDAEKKLLNTALKPTVLFRIHGETQGAEISFQASFLRENNYELHLSIPKSVKYLQRRKLHREPISYALGISMLISFADGEREAVVRDLSAKGARLQIDNPGGFTPAVGDIVNLCQLKIEESFSIETSIEVRHILNHSSETIVFGVRFSEINKDDQRSLEKFIMTAERNRLRKLRE